MAKHRIYCEVITPEKVVYQGDADMVVAPGIDGELGILPLHIPLMTLLSIGELRVKYDDKQEYIAVDGGYMEVIEDKVVVLANAAELASQIDVKRAKRDKERAEREIEEAKQTGEDFYKAEHDLQRALNRLRMATKRKT